MIENSTMIFGPPGCGKTETLMRRIEDALESGIKPEQIAFVSFSRKAVQEAKERAMKKFGLTDKQLCRFRTLHSTGFQELGIKSSDLMASTDYNAIGRMVGEVFKVIVTPEDGTLLPSDLHNGSKYLKIIDRARYRMIPLEQEWREHDTFNMGLSKCKQIDAQIVEYKSKLHKVDYTDMISLFVDTAEPTPCAILIVDEAQDLTPLQWAMVQKMATVAEEVLIAGDDDQAIHRWTGVDVQLFINMSPHKIVLDKSYRLPKKIFDVGQRIVKRIKNRVPKDYHPTEEEGEVRWHYEMDSVRLDQGSITIMARTNHLVNELASRVYDLGYYHSVNGKLPIPQNVANAIKTWRYLQAGEAVALPLIRELYECVPKQGDRAVVKRGAAKLLDAADPEAKLTMEDLVREFGLKVTDRTAYEAMNLGRSLQSFLYHVEMSGEDITKPPRIKLSTIHRMKGGEDDTCVVYLGTSKMCYENPHQDDEHRAFYVAVTRARKTLHLVESNKRFKYLV